MEMTPPGITATPSPAMTAMVSSLKTPPAQSSHQFLAPRLSSHGNHSHSDTASLFDVALSLTRSHSIRGMGGSPASPAGSAVSGGLNQSHNLHQQHHPRLQRFASLQRRPYNSLRHHASYGQHPRTTTQQHLPSKSIHDTCVYYIHTQFIPSLLINDRGRESHCLHASLRLPY